MGLSLWSKPPRHRVRWTSAWRRAAAGRRRVDAIYTNTDNNVVSAYEALVKVGNDAKIRMIASDTGQRRATAPSPPSASTAGDGQADRPHGGSKGREAGRDQRRPATTCAAVRQSRGRAEARRDPCPTNCSSRPRKSSSKSGRRPRAFRPWPDGTT
ncbi:ABC transporter substrate binding protein [Pseudomonas aeruginosa]